MIDRKKKLVNFFVLLLKKLTMPFSIIQKKKKKIFVYIVLDDLIPFLEKNQHETFFEIANSRD